MAGEALFERLRAEKWNAVEELVNDQAPESLSLEFKTKGFSVPPAPPAQPGKLNDDDKRNLAKSISAFANTDGGCLIFGISTKDGKGTEADRAKKPEPIEQLAAFKRSVEAILKDVTNPAVPNIELLDIEDAAGSDRGVLAIRIPQSIGRPHRACMGPEHYYMRVASRSDIMPHSILAALMGRVPQPRLSLRVTLWMQDSETAPFQPSLRFLLELENFGRGTARQPALRIFEAESEGIFWHHVLSSTQLASGWLMRRVSTEVGERGTVLLSTGPETVVYPGERILLTDAGPGTFTMGGWHWGRGVELRIKGVIYSVDAAPVEFGPRITVGALRSARVSISLPPNEGDSESS